MSNEESSQAGQQPDRPLPPVEPPSVSFLLQLFVIPLVIVTIIVMVWLAMNWLAHVGSSPRQLVHDLRRLNDASWQRALTLADLLQNPDYDYLKSDREMADELAGVLSDQLDAANADEKSIRLKMFLCRALGEFLVPDVLPPLVRASLQEDDAQDIDVRRAAIEAIAVFAANNEQTPLSEDDEVMEALRVASRERSEAADRESRAELRSTAAFALGVIGGEEAQDRLALMVADGYANARYNAGLGLARHGDIRALAVLLEMLDPDNEASAASEQHEGPKASKRLLIITNGIRGASELAKNNSTADLSKIKAALESIEESELTMFHSRAREGIRITAKEALLAGDWLRQVPVPLR